MRAAVPSSGGGGIAINSKSGKSFIKYGSGICDWIRG